MKKYLIKESEKGGEKTWVLEDAEMPQLGAGEVLVKMKAASLNYRDLLMKGGLSASGGEDPVVPLSDGMGEVVELGSGVTGFNEGDRVALTFFVDWEKGGFDMVYHQAARGGSCDGVLAEYVSVPAHSVVPIPDYLSDEAAACLPCAALTAWQALVERRARGIEVGDTVLCLGTGGVSIFALQIAKALGAEVIITSSSEDKIRKAEALRADHGICYTKVPDWEKSVFEITKNQGAEHIVEVGGPGTIGKSMDAIKAGGTISLVGVLTGFESPDASIFPLVARAVDLHGIYVGSRNMFLRMIDFFETHQIQPVIDRSFGFEEALEAAEYLESGAHFGKVVIKIQS